MPRRPIHTIADPCAALKRALVALRAAYPEPTTKKQIDAWNKAEEALEQAQRKFGERERHLSS